MRGQTEITELRLCGYKPSMVWVLVLQNPCQTRFFCDAENSIELSGMPEVHIGIDDNIGLLDFRFLHQLTVLLQGLDTDRLRQAFRRIREFSPQRIITSSPTIFHDTQVESCKT